MTDWSKLTRDLIAEMEVADPIWRPTNFWVPGVQSVLDDFEKIGPESFKQWPSRGWFNPRYGRRLDYRMMDAAFEALEPFDRNVTKPWLRGQLSGSADARRDFDVARVAWDRDRWPLDLEAHGESEVGNPPQRFALTGDADRRWGRAYLNYAMLMSGLSREVDSVPRSFIEIGGGFGVLGELVMTHDAAARYVNIDIPPLLSVSSYYLSEIEPRTTLPNELPAGPIEVGRAACVPTWRIPDVQGPFDVFVNSYSFQEMEPHVVANYVREVSRIGTEWIVSLNSRDGKRRASDDRPGGAIEPVTSAFIAEQFEAEGYRTIRRYGREFVGPTPAELLIMRRA